MFEDDEEENPAKPNDGTPKSGASATEASTVPAAGGDPLPDAKASTGAVAPKGVSAAEAKARLLSLSQVFDWPYFDGRGAVLLHVVSVAGAVAVAAPCVFVEATKGRNVADASPHAGYCIRLGWPCEQFEGKVGGVCERRGKRPKQICGGDDDDDDDAGQGSRQATPLSTVL